MTFENYLISSIVFLAGVIGVMARYIVSSRQAQQLREDLIHEQCDLERKAAAELLHETRREFTTVLYGIAGIEPKA